MSQIWGRLNATFITFFCEERGCSENVKIKIILLLKFRKDVRNGGPAQEKSRTFLPVVVRDVSREKAMRRTVY